MSATRFSSQVEQALRKAGWYEGRQQKFAPRAGFFTFKRADTVYLPPKFVIFPAAEKILREFGGLKIREIGQGIECGSADIDIFPDLGDNLFDELGGIRIDSMRLYPLGEASSCIMSMFVLESGAIYAADDDIPGKYADSFDIALEMLLLGLKTPPSR